MITGQQIDRIKGCATDNPVIQMAEVGRIGNVEEILIPLKTVSLHAAFLYP
jgi:hypothetical protein